MEALYSVIEAFEDLKNKEVIKLSIINGIFWAVVWSVLAFVFWPIILDISKFLINILPFKFIQNAGAEFVFMILWLEMVLVSIGIFFSLFNQILSKKFISIIIALVFAFFWLIVFFYFKNEIIGYVAKLIKIFPFETVEETVSVVLSIFIFYSLYIITLYLGFLLYSEKLLIKLIEYDYPSLDIESNFSKIELLKIVFKDFFIFVTLLLLLYPLLFIPIINLIFIVFLWSFAVKNALYNTAKSVIGNIKIKKNILWTFSIISIFFNFIPLVNIFAPSIGILSFYHYIIEKTFEKE